MRPDAYVATVTLFLALAGDAAAQKEPARPPEQVEAATSEPDSGAAVDRAIAPPMPKPSAPAAQRADTTAADCRRMLGCRMGGLCTPQESWCVAASDADCRRSEYCELGRCTATGGWCVVGSDADCSRSRLCALKGWCTAKANACVAVSGSRAAVEPPPLRSAAEPALPGDAADGLGLQVALAGGLGLPIGLAVRVPIDKSAPIALSVGSRLLPNVVVAFRTQYAFFVVEPGSDHCEGHCSGGDVRIGASLEYHLVPGSVADPWAGLDAGLEYQHFAVDATAVQSYSRSFALQATPARLGTDFRLSRRLVLGPTVGLSFSHWLSGKSQNSWGGDPPTREPWLGWVEFAVRVAFVPAPVGSSPIAHRR